jgi:hypothetical protein
VGIEEVIKIPVAWVFNPCVRAQRSIRTVMLALVLIPPSTECHGVP